MVLSEETKQSIQSAINEMKEIDLSLSNKTKSKSFSIDTVNEFYTMLINSILATKLTNDYKLKVTRSGYLDTYVISKRYRGNIVITMPGKSIKKPLIGMYGMGYYLGKDTKKLAVGFNLGEISKLIRLCLESDTDKEKSLINIFSFVEALTNFNKVSR